MPRPRPYARDADRLQELTKPHPGPLIRDALVHMTPRDWAKTIAILGRIGDPREGVTDDDVA
jgi:hypothetical protein